MRSLFRVNQGIYLRFPVNRRVDASRRADGSQQGRPLLWPSARALPRPCGRGSVPHWEMWETDWEMILQEEPGAAPMEPRATRAHLSVIQGSRRGTQGHAPRRGHLHHLRGHERDPAPGDRPHPRRRADPLGGTSSGTRVDHCNECSPSRIREGLHSCAARRVKPGLGDGWEIA